MNDWVGNDEKCNILKVQLRGKESLDRNSLCIFLHNLFCFHLFFLILWAVLFKRFYILPRRVNFEGCSFCDFLDIKKCYFYQHSWRVGVFGFFFFAFQFYETQRFFYTLVYFNKIFWFFKTDRCVEACFTLWSVFSGWKFARLTFFAERLVRLWWFFRKFVSTSVITVPFSSSFAVTTSKRRRFPLECVFTT